jgi:TatA/E family protein of Tat protein translocase
MTELILVLVIALVVLGPEKLPPVAKAMGRAMREFRKATREITATLEVEEVRRTIQKRVDEEKSKIKQVLEDPTGSAKTADKKLEAKPWPPQTKPVGPAQVSAPADPYTLAPPAGTVAAGESSGKPPAEAVPAAAPSAPAAASEEVPVEPELAAYLQGSDAAVESDTTKSEAAKTVAAPDPGKPT